MKNSNIVIFTKLLKAEKCDNTAGMKKFLTTLDSLLSLDKKLLMIALNDSRILWHAKRDVLEGFLYHYRYLAAVDKITMLAKLRYDLDQEIKRRKGVKEFRIVSAKKLNPQEREELLGIITQLADVPKVRWYEDPSLIFGFVIENEETKIDCSFVGLRKSIERFVYKQVMKND